MVMLEETMVVWTHHMRNGDLDGINLDHQYLHLQ
jgi:hypothetical protein